MRSYASRTPSPNYLRPHQVAELLQIKATIGFMIASAMGRSRSIRARNTERISFQISQPPLEQFKRLIRGRSDNTSILKGHQDATSKHEWTNHQTFSNLEEARLSVFKYMETFLQSGKTPTKPLGYLSPDRYEAENAPAAAA